MILRDRIPPWPNTFRFIWGQCRVNCNYLLVSDDQYPHNLTLHLGHESLQQHPILTNKRTKQQMCKFTCVYWIEYELDAPSCISVVLWIHMKWLHSHSRSNYQFWSCGSDSWGVSQRGKCVQLNSHQSVPWHTCDIPRYSKTIIITSSSHTSLSKTIIISF